MMKQVFSGRGAAAHSGGSEAGDDAKIFSPEDWGAGYSAQDDEDLLSCFVAI